MAFFPLRPQRNPLAMPVQMPQNGYYSGTQPMPTGSQLGLGQQVQAAVGGMPIPQRPPIGFSPLQNYPTYVAPQPSVQQQYDATMAGARQATQAGVAAMPNFTPMPSAGVAGSYMPRSGRPLNVTTMPNGSVRVSGNTTLDQWRQQPSTLPRSGVDPRIVAMLPQQGQITRGMVDDARRSFQKDLRLNGPHGSNARIVARANARRLPLATPAVRAAYKALGIPIPGERRSAAAASPQGVTAAPPAASASSAVAAMPSAQQAGLAALFGPLGVLAGLYGQQQPDATADSGPLSGTLGMPQSAPQQFQPLDAFNEANRTILQTLGLAPSANQPQPQGAPSTAYGRMPYPQFPRLPGMPGGPTIYMPWMQGNRTRTSNK